MKARNLLLVLIAVCVGISLGYRIPRKGSIEPIKTKVDTLYVFDTIVSVEPIYVAKRVIDSVLVPVTDTLRMRDTLYVYLEREQVEWKDSLSVVYASGIQTKVDSVKHFIKDRYITIETAIPVKEKTRWGVGVQAGYGVGKGGLTPYVGIGLSYDLFRW